jgi:hypothetical protein
MRQAEPPSSSKSSPFLIGQNSRGNWVVRDQRGLRGGIFVDCVEALRFAMSENGNRPRAVVMVPGVFELDISRRPGTGHRPPAQTRRISSKSRGIPMGHLLDQYRPEHHYARAGAKVV